MYASIRRYTIPAASVDTLMGQIDKRFSNIVSGTDGFVAYYAIDADNKPTFAEIGHGNLDWPRIVAAAKASGCEWYIVEQDRCDGDPFDSLKMSFDYITQNLLD